uniref:Cytochrome P450 n=1 Tax=Kalanchoe fedtschenkoi TaxID=63787 RepID=A0A7N0V4E9_KALFE
MAAMIGGESFLEADGRQERADDGGGSGLREILTELMVLLGAPNVSDFFPALAWIDLQGIETRAKRVFARFDGLIDKAITQSQNKPKQVEKEVQQGKGSTDFLQQLLGLQDSESSLSLAKIKAMLMDTMVGGMDTTATMVEWTLTELMLHGQVMKKVQDELTEVVGLSDLVEETHLVKLKYLDAAVKETMRLHTPVPLLVPRRPVETTEIRGYRIPKDARIFTNVWAIQRDPSLWDNPRDFTPERFLNCASKKWDYSGNNMQYLPFGSGRRMCPGFALAEKSVMHIVASFLHCFNWQVPEGVKIGVETKFGIVLKKRDSLVAIPTPRLSNLELYA